MSCINTASWSVQAGHLVLFLHAQAVGICVVLEYELLKVEEGAFMFQMLPNLQSRRSSFYVIKLRGMPVKAPPSSLAKKSKKSKKGSKPHLHDRCPNIGVNVGSRAVWTHVLVYQEFGDKSLL